MEPHSSRTSCPLTASVSLCSTPPRVRSLKQPWWFLPHLLCYFCSPVFPQSTQSAASRMFPDALPLTGPDINHSYSCPLLRPAAQRSVKQCSPPPHLLTHFPPRLWHLAQVCPLLSKSVLSTLIQPHRSPTGLVLSMLQRLPPKAEMAPEKDT